VIADKETMCDILWGEGISVKNGLFVYAWMVLQSISTINVTL
jgi:hypothetical protein